MASGKLPQLSVFGDDYPTPDGTGMRDYIHVMDLVEGHVAAMQAKSNVSGVHLFNLGSGRAYSVLEIIRAFEVASGLTIPFQIKPRRDAIWRAFTPTLPTPKHKLVGKPNAIWRR